MAKKDSALLSLEHLKIFTIRIYCFYNFLKHINEEWQNRTFKLMKTKDTKLYASSAYLAASKMAPVTPASWDSLPFVIISP